MNTVKTYQEVNSKNQNMSFGISRMQDIYKKHGGAVDEPHRHDYYTVLIISKAKGQHKIDFNTYDLSDRQIYFVAPGQVHQMIETEMSTGFAMTFSNQFLVENSISLSFIDGLNLFQNYGQSPPLVPEANQFDTIYNFAANIFELFNSDAVMKYLSIGAFLKLLLIECNNVCTINPIYFDLNTPSNNLIKAFKNAVDHNYRKEHSTTYYANELHITPDHLNRIVKEKIGKTAKEYIQARITTEAKRLLYFTDEPSKEIAYELGFSEPANFSAFFKKQTTLSPSKFKKSEIKS
ncbi:AraC family transcriptional regulator [Mariniflexile ostreae]|uniref:AraC family transcriptional regulator n=1 Tax=Mariniflexile ostreae TaxID=1520892 RepID=A0ABV5F8C1_9FLAO